ncbi:hypothetical protein OAZ27_05625 [Bacteroidia bacterium]|nr:hypothetical protein [Bacteroidia bacterium]
MFESNTEVEFDAPKAKKNSNTSENQDSHEVVRIGGLKNMMKSVGVKSNVSEPISGDIPESEAINNNPLKSLTLDDSRRLFVSYAQELTVPKRTSLAAFLSDPLLKIGDNNTVIFTVGSKIVESEIKEEAVKIVAHFEKNGYALSKLNCIVNAKQISDYKMFTPKQQFDSFAEKYPKLNDFAERFYLDFD